MIFIAQRKVHSDAEWKAFFDKTMRLVSNSVTGTEFDIRKHHNARAFLLSVLATASTSEDAGIKQLLEPVRNALKLVP